MAMAIGLALAACEEVEAPKEAEIRPVRTVVVEPKPIKDSRQAIGEIKPRHETDVSFRVSGKLVSRGVDVGAMVDAGSVLAKLDDQDYRNKVQSAETDIAAAEAVLSEARSTEERQQKLVKTGVTTRANLEVAVKNLQSAQAELDAALVAAAMAHDQLSYAELKADFGGLVTAVGAEAGQVVNVGQMIVRLANPSERDAVFSVAEVAFRGFKPGDTPEVQVTLLSDPSVSITGVVHEVSPMADPATRTYQVKVALKDAPVEMRFGASVSGRLKIATPPVVVLPGSALFDKGGKPAVWVYNADSTEVTLRLVVVGSYETDKVVIAEGLAKGDVVVTAGVNQLREGQKVRFAETVQP
jgi:RND family efflux transporter MFP subunit